MVNSQIQKERPSLIWYPSIGCYTSFYPSNVIQVIQNNPSHEITILQVIKWQNNLSHKIAK